MFQSLLSLFIIVFFMTSCSKQPEPLVYTIDCKEEFYSLKSAECMDLAQLTEQLEHYPVIFIGDHHDSDEVHLAVAAMLKRLHREGYNLFVANEWFTPEDNELLRAYVASEIDDVNLTEKVMWKKRVGYEFKSFMPIYHAARETNTTLYGINLSKNKRKKISDKNITAMQPETLALYTTLDTNISAHKQMLSPYFSHCHALKQGESNAECIERMYRVQVAWDSAMGENSAVLANKILKNKKDKLIVFVGAYHLAYGLGANLRFARHSTLPYVTLLPLMKSVKNVEVGEADYLFIYEPKLKNKDDHNSSAEAKTYVYECQEDYQFVARTEGENIWLFLPQKTVKLPHIISASGAKYSEGDTLFWSKGNEVMLKYDGRNYHGCVNNRKKAIWEDAKLNGADFRGVGNEPGWSFEIRKGGNITYIGDYGDTRYKFKTPEPKIQSESRRALYRVSENGHTLRIEIEGKRCQDTMSDDTYESTVTITIDGKQYSGCGKALH